MCHFLFYKVGRALQSKRFRKLLLLIENGPNYLDPQFESYVMPAEPNLLDEGVDWSDLKKLDVGNESIEDNHDPVLQGFKNRQREPRLLTVHLDGSFSFTLFASNDVPCYAILS